MKKSGYMPFTHESLLSSMDIQGWNLKIFTEEIYEHIGQLLSLAKIQIATINPEKKEEAKQIVESSDQLLNRVIKDLRSLAKQLSPNEIMHEGFVYSLRYELGRLNRLGLWKTDLQVHGKPFRLEDVRELIFFSIIQHFILKALYVERVQHIKVEIIFSGNMINVSISYPVNKELISRIRSKKGLGISRRAKLIAAVIRTKIINEQKTIGIKIKKIFK